MSDHTRTMPLTINEVHAAAQSMGGAIEGLRLAVETACTDADDVNWPACSDLVDVALAAYSTLLELTSDLRLAREDSLSDTMTLRFEPNGRTDFGRRVEAVSPRDYDLKAKEGDEALKQPASRLNGLMSLGSDLLPAWLPSYLELSPDDRSIVEHTVRGIHKLKNLPPNWKEQQHARPTVHRKTSAPRPRVRRRAVTARKRKRRAV